MFINLDTHVYKLRPICYTTLILKLTTLLDKFINLNIYVEQLFMLEPTSFTKNMKHSCL